MSPARQRIAIVAPFFGRELRGRKERFTFAFATHLALEGVELEVITTTARDEAADESYYRSGTDHTEAFPVHRFRVAAPDRAAYADAVLAFREAAPSTSQERALIDERLRSPDLFGHLRAVGDRYDAFIFVDATAPTTVHGVAEVAETAAVLPLLDDPRVARLPAVVEALRSARLVLCTSDAEASLAREIAGGRAGTHVRAIGIAADATPAGEIAPNALERARRMQPYVLVTGDDAEILAAIASSGCRYVPLEGADDRERAALFSCAEAIAVAERDGGIVPEIVEGWAYGKAAIVPAASFAAAALVREAGGGRLAGSDDEWRSAIAEAAAGSLQRFAAAGEAYVSARGGWRAVARRTSEAIDAIAAIDDGRSREALLAQIGYLYPLVQRQRRTIDAMRVSRFWRLRNAWFGLKARLGIGPAQDPIPEPTADERAVALAAIGDQYQLFREQHRLRSEDAERVRAMTPLLPRLVRFGLVLDARGAELDALAATLRSLCEQLYPHWNVRVLGDSARATWTATQELCAQDERITLLPSTADQYGDAEFVGPIDAGDALEPHALFECALVLQADEADVIYSDEDRLDDDGIARDPWFKADWSPETALTRDFVGRMLLLRRALLERVGGVRDVLESARWYDALLRVSEGTDRVHHIAQVLYHRRPANATRRSDAAIAVESAVRRRGEEASIVVKEEGVDVRYASHGEPVTIVIPTRDRADLLQVCLQSIFERTAYPAFDVLVVDNGSKEDATKALFAQWAAREPARFRVLADPAPFNYSRLNNAAVRATSSPYVAFLNNDTEVIAPGWLEAMVGQARREKIGAVGALLLYGDGSVQHGGVVLGILGLAGHAHRYFPGDAPGYHGALQLDTNYLAVTGACMVIAKAKYEEVGGLDETLAVAYNDVDLCLKLRQRGYRNVVVPCARLYHYESKSRGIDDTPSKVARAAQEVAEIRARWAQWSIRDPYYNPNLTVDAEDFGLRL